MSRPRKRNGYSLAEVVIALTVIVTVSITALSIVLSSVATTINAINKAYAQSFADNVWESFKAAETQEEFLSLVAFAEGVALADSTTDESGKTLYTYYSEKNKFTAQISVDLSNTERDEFAINVTDWDGDSIISFSYQKGDGI